MATTDTAEATTETDDAPAVDDRDPSTLIPAAVDEILELAATWLAWDGAPVLSDGNAWTPLKALRRACGRFLLLSGRAGVCAKTMDRWVHRGVPSDPLSSGSPRAPGAAGRRRGGQRPFEMKETFYRTDRCFTGRSSG
jgi:hypothetical protein